MTQKPNVRAGRREHGMALTEFAFVAPILLILIFGVSEVGRMFYQYSTLYKGVRDAAKYVSENAIKGTTGAMYPTSDPGWTQIVQTAQDLVVYGNPTPGTQPVVRGLATSNVQVQQVDSTHIRVDIQNYQYHPLFTCNLLTFGFGSTGVCINFSPAVTMRAL